MFYLQQIPKLKEGSHPNRGFIYLLLSVSFLFCSMTFAQNNPDGLIRGKVLDSMTGEPIPDVNIIITGTAIGASTNEAGEYVIRQIPPGMRTIVFTHIGYITHKHTRNFFIGSEVAYSVILYPDHIRLDEIEIIADTTDRYIRRRAAGSELITAAQIEASGVHTFSELIRHLVPRATVHEEGSSVYISLLRATSIIRRYHGDNNPLIIIDGIKYGTSPFGLGDIVPVDQIDKMEIIRGPAAMRYGADARHGVIIIDTKPSTISGDPIFNTYKIIAAGFVGLLMFLLF